MNTQVEEKSFADAKIKRGVTLTQIRVKRENSGAQVNELLYFRCQTEAEAWAMHKDNNHRVSSVLGYYKVKGVFEDEDGTFWVPENGEHMNVTITEPPKTA